MKVDIKSVAKEADVSIATVSRVINNNPGVREKTRKKVLKAISDLKYEVNSVASNLRQKKTNTIGIIIGNILSQFDHIIAKSVEDIAYKNGYNILLTSSDNDPEKELKQLKTLKSNRVDGIILAPTGKNVDYINRIIASGTEIVLIDRQIEGLQFDTVQVDNENGAFEAVDFLLGQGYKKIAIITGDLDTTTGKKRLDGYLNALSKSSIPKDDKLIKVGDFTNKSGNILIKELLGNVYRPEAVFVSNLDMTIGALIGIKEIGLTIPGDIGIIGFDDFELSQLLDPPITTVNQPTYKVGSTATELLIKKIEDSNLNIGDTPNIISLNTNLIIRDSTRKFR
jgi:LacI family transcriptional regulator